MTHSNKRGSSRKPAKSKSGFPLTRHPSGRWCKKVKGRFYYFGKIADDPDGKAALDLWLAQRDDILAGRKPRADHSGLTLDDLVQQFLHYKRQLVESGELAERTWTRYRNCCKFLLDHFGRTCPAARLRPEDFQELRAVMAKRWGAAAMANEIQMTRTLFRYGHEAELLDTPIRFGPGFRKPSAKTLRQTKVDNGPRMFQPEQIRALLEVATVNMRGMILLAINGGLGNTDIAMLPEEAIDLETCWLDWPRPKTAIARRVPLWPETVDAIQNVIAERTTPNHEADRELLFIGRRGENYTGRHKGYRIGGEFQRACLKAGVAGRSFYDLRRSFQTVGEDARDLVAVQSIMRHAPPANDMSNIYRQRVSDERLRAVVDTVRVWLFEPPADGDEDTNRPATVPFRIVG